MFFYPLLNRLVYPRVWNFLVEMKFRRKFYSISYLRALIWNLSRKILLLRNAHTRCDKGKHELLCDLNVLSPLSSPQMCVSAELIRNHRWCRRMTLVRHIQGCREWKSNWFANYWRERGKTFNFPNSNFRLPRFHESSSSPRCVTVSVLSVFSFYGLLITAAKLPALPLYFFLLGSGRRARYYSSI